jgi:tRNA threonylcarbamoyladenosine modification (KEOPS) complex  Pcc1 subunit
LSLRAFFGVRRNRFAAYLMISVISIWFISGAAFLPPLVQLLRPQAQASGWLSSWNYRRSIVLSPATSVAGYQTKVTLTSANFNYAQLSFPATGADLRFTGSDGTTLQNYWIESWNNGGTSTVWVKVANSGTSSIYMYYGNIGASAVTNADNTFDLYDDFTGSSLNTTKWPSHAGETVSGGILGLNVRSASEAGSEDYIISSATFSPGSILEFYAARNPYLRAGLVNERTSFGIAGQNHAGVLLWGDGLYYGDYAGGGADYRIPSTPAYNNAYHTTKIAYGNGYGAWYLDGTLVGTTSSNMPVMALKVFFRDEGLVDWVRVRKYAATEPASTVGSEESVPSNDANLSGLALSAGTLSPNFYFATGNYTASVGNLVSSITVTPTASKGAAATIAVNGAAVVSGSASSSINLNTGSNTITILVTAPDSVTQDTYTVTITRALSSNADLSNLALSAGTLSPSFSSGTVSYTDSVPGVTTSLTITPTVSEAHATVTVNGNAVTSGSPSSSINLSIGNNTVTIIVTAQDGTQKTYSVTVNVPDALDHFTLSGSGTQTAGNPQTLTITAIGRSGQAYNGYFNTSHTLIFSGASAIGSNVPKCAGTDFGTGTTLTFNGSGVATCSLILYKAESPLDISVAEGSYNANGHTLGVTVSPAAVSSLALSTTGPYVSETPFNINLTAKDAYGNVTDNASPSITLSADHGAAVSPTPIIATAGTYNDTLTISHIYTDTNGVILTASTNSGTVTTTASLNVTGVEHLDHFTLSGSGTQTAGTPQLVTITAVGMSGSTYTDYNGNRSLTFSGANSVGTNNPTCRDRLGADVPFGEYTSLAFTNGQANCALTLYKAEVPLNINASEFGKDATGHTLAVTVNPMAVASLSLGVPGSVSSGTPFILSVIAKDMYGNITTNSNLSVSLSADHGGSVSPSSVTATNGTYENAVTLSHIPANTSGVILTASTDSGSITAMTSTDVVPASWYDRGGTWAYRKLITITNNNGSILSGYQVKLNLNTSGLVPSKMKSDCSDIRFSGSDGNPIPYWIESGCGSASTVVWVKPVSLAAGINSIYMYYGNAAAASASSGNDVFPVFSDANDPMSNGYSTKWTGRGASKVGNELYISGYDSGASTLPVSLSSPWVVEAKFRNAGHAGHQCFTMAVGNGAGSTWGSNNNAFLYWNDNTSPTFDYTAEGVQSRLYGNLSTNTYIVSLKMAAADNYSYYLYDPSRTLLASASGVKSAGSGAADPDPATGIQLNTGSNWENADIYASWVLVRKYAASEPASAAGSEENNFSGDLSSLAVSAGTITPSFDPAVTSYSASVVGATNSVTVTPTVAAGGATVTVNGSSVTSGSSSAPINLNVGSNTISITVTAQDTSTKTYTLAINRATSPQDIPSNNSVINVTQIVTSEITISAPANVIMSPSIAGMTGGTANGSATWTVKTNNAAGFIMKIKASTSPALTATGGSFADYTQTTSGVPDFSWSIDNAASEFGYTVEPSVTDDTTSLFKDDGNNCNAGSLNTTDKCWAAFNTTDATILNRATTTTSSGEDTVIKMRAQSGPSHHQIQGNYQATVTVTALAN